MQEFLPSEFLIMVIDDLTKNLQVVGAILDREGYSTTFVTNGQQALQRIKVTKPDLILLDLMMPDMDGLQVCRHLKSDPNYREIPVIFLTASHEQEDLVEAFTMGAVDYIKKPFNSQELLIRVKTHLEMRHTYRKLENTLTELRSTQMQVIQNEKLSSLGKMAGGIAHEINNSNNFIYANIYHLTDYYRQLFKVVDNPDFLSREELNSEYEVELIRQDIPRILQSLREGSQRIREVVNTLRQFASLDQSPVKLVDLNQSVEQSLLILQYRQSHHIVIEKNLGKLPLVECAPAPINQVFFNLLDNAFDALEGTDYPGKIVIQTESINHQLIKISIADNGPGIPLEIQNQIFDPFFTNKPIGEGTGLGLSICYQVIVKEHQGQIHCHSQPGEGTEFIIQLPVKLG